MLFQIVFSHCEFCLYQKGNSSSKLLMPLHSLSFYQFLLVFLATTFQIIFIRKRKTRAWLYCKVFNKEHNIVILFSKQGQNFNQKLFQNQIPALTQRESKFSADSVISARPTWSLFSRTWCYMTMLSYDMKFRITSFNIIEPLPKALFFPMYLLVST